MDELKKALHAEPLTQDEAHRLMGRIMSGDLTPAQTAGVLIALRTRGESLEEITGFARGMREAAVPVRVSRRPLLDIVGTGGVAPEAFNISPRCALWPRCGPSWGCARCSTCWGP